MHIGGFGVRGLGVKRLGVGGLGAGVELASSHLRGLLQAMALYVETYGDLSCQPLPLFH
jgi:hypothetical protein